MPVPPPPEDRHECLSSTEFVARPSLLSPPMRIQQTDRILKNSRAARHSHKQRKPTGNAITRAWRVIVGLVKR